MKRSKLRSAAPAALALAMLATSCSAFHAQSDIDVKPVSVNLVFGAKAPKKATPAPGPGLLPTGNKPIDLGLPEPEPEPSATKQPHIEICPRTEAVGADRPAGVEITKENEPRVDNYPFRYLYNFEDEPEYQSITFDQIKDFSPTGNGYAYSVIDGSTNMALRFEVQPPAEGDTPNPPGQTGLFLQEIKWPGRTPRERAEGKTYTFKPSQHMQLLTFPITNGNSQESFGDDTEGKQDIGVTDPTTGQPVLKPSVNQLHSIMDVGGTENIEVCKDIANVWRVAWTFESTGEFNFKFVGTFWLGTAYGGWPLRSSFTATADSLLMAGNFTKTLLRLDPGQLI